MLQKAKMGRVVVDLVIANNRDVVALGSVGNVLDRVKHVVVSGVVDSGAMRLVLPQRVVDQLGLTPHGETMVRYADDRREKRPIVSNVWLQLLGRDGVFNAVVEPRRNDALVGAIVLEDLDLLVDCGTQAIYPRDPDTTITEIE